MVYAGVYASLYAFFAAAVKELSVGDRRQIGEGEAPFAQIAKGDIGQNSQK